MLKKHQQKNELIKIKSSDLNRLDRFLADRYPDFSRMYFKRLIKSRGIMVNEKAVSPHAKLRLGDEVSVTWPVSSPVRVTDSRAAIPFPILYEDRHLFIINKPAGLLSHPAGSHNTSPTLADILLPKVSPSGWPDQSRPGLVHRLDRDTSGVMVFAKTPPVHAALAKQFADRVVKKTYFALVKGVPETKQGTLECRIGRDPVNRKLFRVASDGREAISEFRVKEHYGTVAALIQMNPLTGRTHQIRVQLLGFGHPVLGDRFYRGSQHAFSFIKRQLLHAAKITFQHPVTKKKTTFEAPLPDDFRNAIKIIRSTYV